MYNAEEGVCNVTVVHAGEYLELKVKPNDRCHWLKIEHELSMLDGEETTLPVQQVSIKYDLDGKKMRIETPQEANPFN
jgi:hypothetical protein